MNTAVLADWLRTPLHAVPVLAVLAAVLAFAATRVRRSAGHPPAAVVVAALGALLCTAYSGDTSWNFAADHLGMSSAGERSIMFAAAELGLFSMALMARQNLRTSGAPGTPGALVWVITGVQVIPAFSESGIVGGFVRAFVGPVLAALLWHLAMGIELRHAKPGAASQSLPAVLVRELRERMLSRFGLAQRGRDAAQITRDRWTRIATRRAARLADLEAAARTRGRTVARARRRLAVAVDRTDAGVLDGQRAVLLDRIAAYRGAGELASMALPAPWANRVGIDTTDAEPVPAEIEVERVPEATEPVPDEAYPAIGPGVPDVPEAVPAGARPAASPGRQSSAAGAQAEYPKDPLHALRDRIGDTAFHDLWPDVQHEPDDDSPPPPGEDTLTPLARRDYLADLLHGTVPSIRTLRGRYSIGQDRAARIQSELKKAMA
ncbi:hypothetical protein [Streptomyces sp. NPDC008139]|uniref:hypothetical protein n=1 Tax=Streptomyces sp. NPDC008139 TaxID=3364814 RepID=UPI0036E7D596